MRVVRTDCPKCGALLRMETESNRIECPYCGKKFTAAKEHTQIEYYDAEQVRLYGQITMNQTAARRKEVTKHTARQAKVINKSVNPKRHSYQPNKKAAASQGSGHGPNKGGRILIALFVIWILFAAVGSCVSEMRLDDTFHNIDWENDSLSDILNGVFDEDNGWEGEIVWDDDDWDDDDWDDDSWLHTVDEEVITGDDEYFGDTLSDHDIEVVSGIELSDQRDEYRVFRDPEYMDPYEMNISIIEALQMNVSEEDIRYDEDTEAFYIEDENYEVSTSERYYAIGMTSYDVIPADVKPLQKVQYELMLQKWLKAFGREYPQDFEYTYQETEDGANLEFVNEDLIQNEAARSGEVGYLSAVFSGEQLVYLCDNRVKYGYMEKEEIVSQQEAFEWLPYMWIEKEIPDVGQLTISECVLEEWEIGDSVEPCWIFYFDETDDLVVPVPAVATWFE